MIIKKVIKTIPIYGGRWMIIFCDDIEKDIREKYGIDRPMPFTNALTAWKGTKYSYLTAFNIREVTIGLIAHESKHLLNRIYLHNDIKLDLGNDEPECYLLSWLVNRIYENWMKVKTNEKN